MLWSVPLLPLLAAPVIYGLGKRWLGEDRGRAALALGRKAGAIFPGGGWRLRERLTVYLRMRMIQIRRSKHRRLATGQEVLLWKSCSARPVFLRKIR